MPSTINAQPGNSTSVTALIKTGAADANLVLQTNGANAVVINGSQIANFVSTGAVKIPAGTTAQRPSPAVNGMIRYNTDFGGLLEGYVDGAWTAVTGSYTYTATYLVVAGGGAGGGTQGGGGGAGGLLSNTATLTGGTTYNIVVGAGGSTGGAVANGNNGSNSSALGFTAIGGGGGAYYLNTGNAGGSGGGGGGRDLTTQPGGSGTSGQGNNGGAGKSDNATYRTGGAGGGAGAVGGSGVNASTPVIGGAGLSYSISGSSVFYAGGGGGGGISGSVGGNGGGGTGGIGATSPTSGTANRGGGGGGGDNAQAGAAGGSGVVILSVPTGLFSNVYTGSNVVVTTSGANTIITFNSSGSYTG